MNTAMTEFLTSWNETRARTTDLLASLSIDDIERKLPRSGLDTISKHLQEMLAVEAAFVSGFEYGSVDFSQVPAVDDFAQSVSVDHLTRQFEIANERLTQILTSGSEKQRIDCFDEIISPERLALYMMSHEVFHHGQLTAFMYATDIPIPESWIAHWALSKQA